MIKRLSVLLMLCLVVTVNAVHPEEKPPANSQNQEKKTKAVSISLFIPGLHQLQSGQVVKGTLLLGSFAACIAGAVIHNNKGNKWYDQYLGSTNVEEIVMLREKTEKSFKKRNLFMIGIAGIWLAHIIDLKFFKSKKSGVKGEVGKNSILIGFYYSF
jgi:TM2 domain-containing membrane protein YozV